MFKIPLIILLVGVLVSCSSRQSVNTDLDELAIERGAREDKVVGEDFPDWIHDSGSDGEFIYTVGTAEYPLTKPGSYVVEAASLDGRGKVLQDAPSDYKAIIQSAIGESLGAHGDFNQMKIFVTEVKGVQGIKVDSKKIACRKIKRYSTAGTKLNRLCYVYTYVPIAKLNEAYARALKDKYGVDKANKFKEILQSQLSKLSQ
ncbi:hypothetical protein [Halobacteriovorax sp. JY17]|uniref:hypothetical protein n=1 Tax=Halobacteriovorax sp. JY17 TaxID=2014617 RepID=UPI000C56F2B8|nr:hypothetical protein [Halobacteriovorax sp. JY17]PIK15102.1 MAG: hypothetical protein CES88_12270 [Halobacteriovorax sp. JY17]